MKPHLETPLTDLKQFPVLVPEISFTVQRPRHCTSPFCSHFITGKHGADRGQCKALRQRSHPHKPEVTPGSLWQLFLFPTRSNELQYLELWAPRDTRYKAVLFPLGYKRLFHIKRTDSSSKHQQAQKPLASNPWQHIVAYCSISIPQTRGFQKRAVYSSDAEDSSATGLGKVLRSPDIPSIPVCLAPP